MSLSHLNNKSTDISFLQLILDSIEECILVIDLDQKILFINKTFQDRLDENDLSMPLTLKCGKLLQKNGFHCRSSINQCPFDYVSLSKKNIKTIQEYVDKKNIKHYIELSITPLFDENNNIYAFVESRRDISEHIILNRTLKEKEQQLYDLAHVDLLTGIPNRRLFVTHLSKCITAAKKNKRLIAVLFIDLDNFKQINDTLGHLIGDEVLKITAKRLQRMLRTNDFVCRLGGDEFVILIDPIKSHENAGLLAKKIIKNQSQKINIKDHDLFIKSSIGISIYPEDGKNAEELLQHADLAMYKSKQTGRNTYSFYSHELTEQSLNQMLIEKALNQAIQKDQLIVYYQPQIYLETGQLTGMEAMIRWNHPTKGLLNPDKFIYIAEKSNLIEEIGQWTLETVFTQIVKWQKDGEFPGRVAVNLAGRQLLNDQLVNNIKNLLEKTGCSATSLEFKITEGFIPHLTDKIIKTLNIFREMGIELSIDDFGKGYASLAFLKRLPITRLKIDRSFIQHDGKEEANEDIAKAIIALGKSLQLKVIAEGVELEDQQSLLSRVGCKEAQGYLFGHPMDSDNMSLFLSDSKIK